MARPPAGHEPAPDAVRSILRAWAEEIISTGYSDAVSLDTLSETWRRRRRSLAAAITDEYTCGSITGTAAWQPDETGSGPYPHTKRSQDTFGRRAGMPPPSAA